MNHPSDSSSPGADSDSGFDFVPPAPTAKRSSSLPTPKPGRSDKAKTTAKRTSTAASFPNVSSAKVNAASPVNMIDTDREIPQTVADKLHRKRSQLSSFVTSTILHTVVFLVLALWAIDRSTDPTIGLTATALDMADVEDSIEPSEVKFDSPEIAESPVENVAENTSTDVEEMASADVPSVVDALPAENTVADAMDPSPVAPMKTLPTGGGLTGRDAESRAKLAARFGGSEGSEAAVEEGLKWIIRHQLSDGSWRFRHHQSGCDGRCRDEGKIDEPPAATGLALMSLLGAGYTHQKGPYRAEVQMGLNYLCDPDNHLRDLGVHGISLGGFGVQPMYSHAIATIAVAEAFAMTGDVKYRKVVEGAYKYIVTAQHPKYGGWKYRPQTRGDMSVTGWMVMAMKACENAGVKPDPEAKQLARKFVDSLAFGDGIRYGYEIGINGDIKKNSAEKDPQATRRGKTKRRKAKEREEDREESKRKPSCTAIGNLMQMYFGREKEHPSVAGTCRFLGEAESSDSDIYYNYYAHLVMHHARPPEWNEWNQTVRNRLIGSQQNNGHERGSWFFPDLHGKVGGRLYTTAMAVMTLEVYYRFMPLYRTDAGEVAGPFKEE